MLRNSDCLIVSYDHSSDGTVLTVAREENETISILHQIQGDNAFRFYHMLISKPIINASEKCKSGLHPLKEISRTSDGFTDKVVRWCPDCGAIVIDMECDGRVYPGHYKKMVLPKLVKDT